MRAPAHRSSGMQMPLYHFHIQDGVHDIAPTVESLADMALARARSLELLADLLRWSPDSIWTGNDLRIEVSNGEGLVLFQLFALASVSTAGRQAEG